MLKVLTSEMDLSENGLVYVSEARKILKNLPVPYPVRAFLSRVSDPDPHGSALT
jgi:hypothetical protein